ncbi:hypothetical protein LTS08_005636 [Lithohypha guttulata]|uniref:Succinate dehydrogenase assembly factor 4, mitochondrial n=1 Tax=Lithohypha guttulata TaxID=1690604 RepID=A0AAN7T2F0_9EURO|nr:hypothetical protein LTR51_003194 [Lithohypha guttulata]KAK5087017.1 hypothetical protein LTR05_004188 [Lithohypha guttulata]KAK5099921.1 hypothetical protein LTS08_005636 [Lithohypha guttulata]
MAHLRTAVPALSAAPRHYLFTRSTAVQITRRSLTTTSTRHSDSNNSSFFGGGAAPPRLPKEEQEIFEALQRQSTGAFSTPRAPPKINQSPDSTPSEVDEAEEESASRAGNMATKAQQKEFKKEFERVLDARIQAQGKGEELHPNVRRGALPEFEGDVNPKTGEVGGPKNEPLRWGASGEWSYNGRATDF